MAVALTRLSADSISKRRRVPLTRGSPFAGSVTALPGEAGTAIEVEYAVHYGKPIIAHLSKGRTIKNLRDVVEQTADLERVKKFLQSHLQWSPEPT
jgi:hypothetical protein